MLSAIISFFLLLLKIIGILLLCLLLLFLGILLIPIRYQFEGKHTEDIPAYLNARITWMLSLIRCHISYDKNELHYDIHILGKRLLSNDPDFLKRKEEKQHRKKEKTPENEQKEEKADKEDIVNVKIEENDVPQLMTDSNNLPEKEDTIDNPSENFSEKSSSDYNPTRIPSDLPDDETAFHQKKKEKKSQKSEDKKETGNKKEIHRKKIRKKDTKKSKNKTKKKVSIEERISHLKEKIVEYKAIAEEYQIKELIRLAKQTLLRILKHILPRHLSGWVHLGFDDPSLTGKVTAIAAMFYPVYGKHFSFEPDFWASCLEGEVQGRGGIRIGFFLWILIYLFTKKEVRRVIRLVLKK